jgi:hypothetical protein
VIGHADRAGPLRDYCQRLIMPCERKSVEPIAAMAAPEQTAAQRQSLLHFVGQSPWPDERVLAKVGKMVLPAIKSHWPIEAWVIDAKLTAHRARSKHFKIHELELRPNDLSCTQEIQAGGLYGPAAIVGPVPFGQYEFKSLAGIAMDVINLFMASLSSRGISNPSLQARGEQRRFFYFNNDRDIPRRFPY